MFAVLRKACEELNARLAFISVFQDIKEALASALFDINLKQKVTHPRTVAGCIMCRVEIGETGVNDKPPQTSNVKLHSPAYEDGTDSEFRNVGN